MFKNRHIQVKLVKDTETPIVDDSTSKFNTEELAIIAKDMVKYIAIASVAVMGVAVTLNTLSQIAVNATDNRNKEVN